MVSSLPDLSHRDNTAQNPHHIRESISRSHHQTGAATVVVTQHKKAIAFTWYLGI